MIHESDKNGGLARKLLDQMGQITQDRHGDLAVANARSNLVRKHLGQSLAALRGQKLGHGDQALVIAAGPSIDAKSTSTKKHGAGITIFRTDRHRHFGIRRIRKLCSAEASFYRVAWI